MRHVVPPLLGVFFALSAIITLSVGITLALPGTGLDVIWDLKPFAHAELMRLRAFAAPGFFLLSAAMAAASFGTFRRRLWGWRLALAIFAANGLGDAVRLVSGGWLEGTIGVIAAGLILYGLTRPGIRALFGNAPRR